jgi:predicted unusual protein kinase regulating ubiquinone biosynthesis (AarF/ABC1/UbiB family)
VKVQYPGVKQSIDSDIDNVISLVKLSGALPKHMNIGPLLEKAKAQLHEEADYRQEAAYIKMYSSLVEDKTQFTIPKVYDELSNEQVLSMSFLSGGPIEAEHPQGDIDLILEHLFQLGLDELFVYRTMQSDPNFANFLFEQSSKRIALLDFGATRQIPKDVSRLYLLLAKAMQSQQTDLIASYLKQLGLIDENMSSATFDVVIQACLLASECLQVDQYNFKQSRLIQRIQDITQPLIENRDATATPAFDVALINRKIIGLVLLANRLGASVNLKSMLDKY